VGNRLYGSFRRFTGLVALMVCEATYPIFCALVVYNAQKNS